MCSVQNEPSSWMSVATCCFMALIFLSKLHEIPRCFVSLDVRHSLALLYLRVRIHSEDCSFRHRPERLRFKANWSNHRNSILWHLPHWHPTWELHSASSSETLLQNIQGKTQDNENTTVSDAVCLAIPPQTCLCVWHYVRASSAFELKNQKHFKMQLSEARVFILFGSLENAETGVFSNPFKWKNGLRHRSFGMRNPNLILV